MESTNLRQVRKARHMTRAALEVASGVSFGTIQAIEQGRQDPKGQTLKKLASALRVSVDQILGLSPLDSSEATGALLARAS